MGFSQWGANATKSACTHKSTKMALTQLNKSLADDLAEAGMAYIGVHNLSPGALSAPTASKEQVNLAALGGGPVRV
jgi:NAD(P)-dependent dehydrogenase (short-subunit alcohol dehydrogenase family)